MMHYLLVAAGGALGAMARYWVYNAGPFAGPRSYLATFGVNVAGSFLIGVAFVLLTEKSSLGPQWRSLLTVGFLGAFTTYSSYSLDALHLLEQALYSQALMYLLGTMVLCLVAGYAGLSLGRMLF